MKVTDHVEEQKQNMINKLTTDSRNVAYHIS